MPRPTLAQPTSGPPGAASTEDEVRGSSFTHKSLTVTIPDADMATLPPDRDPGATGSRDTADPRAGADPFVPDESIDTVDKRLYVTVGGQTHYIRNGGRIEMGDGLEVEVYIDPYPPTTLHSILDVFVTRDGEPVPDISVDVEFDMLSMLHGPFAATARDIGGGHHLATLDYIMFGAWDQFVTIRLGLDRIRFPVVIVAYP